MPYKNSLIYRGNPSVFDQIWVKFLVLGFSENSATLSAVTMKGDPEQGGGIPGAPAGSGRELQARYH